MTTTPAIQDRLSLRDIARLFGVSHETVRRRLIKAGLPTNGDRRRNRCVTCGAPIDHNHKYCSAHTGARMSTLTCNCGCDQVFKRREKLVTWQERVRGYNHHFVDRKHLAKYMRMHAAIGYLQGRGKR